jgi:hypothetical protein
MKIAAAAQAIKLNPANRPASTALPFGVSSHPFKMAIITGKQWPKGKVLGVRFLDGSQIQQAKVEKLAVKWCQYANIGLDFAGKKSAEIRISFQANPGSWSYVGTDCSLESVVPKDQPTMNFGWLTDDTDDIEWRRVVLHEFGHSLGAIHEHQSPKGGIKWNVQAVYAYFSGPPNNWSKEEIDENIIQKYSLDQLNATIFDPDSIMLYEFPPELILGGHGTKSNTDLSKGDKRFIGGVYGKPKK